MSIRQRLIDAWAVLARGAKVAHKRTAFPAITSEEIAEARSFFPMDKFFILGHSRSGNTLLMRLARLHPEVHANYQATFFARPPGLTSLVDSLEIQEWLSRKTNRWNHGHDMSAQVMRAAADFIMESDARRAGAAKHIVGDKSPTSITHGLAVRQMHNIYPDARMVYIVRDGRDVLVSDRFRNFVEEKFLRAGDDKLIADLRKNPEAYLSGEKSIFTEAWLRGAHQGVPSWRDNLAESETEGKRLYAERYYPIRYEDILANPFAEMKKLWLFLGVKEVDPVLEPALHAEIADNPDEKWQAERNKAIPAILSKGHPGSWRKFFTPCDRQVFKEIAGELLVKWGYEKDSNW